MLRAVCGVVVAATAACGGGGVSDTGTGPGPTPPVDTTKPPTVQRASITARVTIDPADASAAATAGVTAAGVTVRLTRSAPGFAPQSAVTAADGTARFDNLLEGQYQLSVDRPLTAGEVQRLPPDERDATLFAGGSDLTLSPPANASRDVPMVAARRGSLIISEIFPFNSPASTNLGYGMGNYFEVYNNSDTTVYLDGVSIATTPLFLHGGWPEYPCPQFNLAARMDSTYLHIGNVSNRFPGSGRDFPLRPGEGRVVATDAINHALAAPGMEQLDLSQAHFENVGSDADTDNPFATNMIRVTSSFGPFGRGTIYNTSNIAYVLIRAGANEGLSDAMLTQTYGTAPAVGTPIAVKRFLRTDVLDLAAFFTDPEEPGAGNFSGITCAPFMATAFERAPAPLMNRRRSIAISRKSLGRSAAGHEILQRTRTSARDFEHATPLRRTLRR
jgi:hypothetical protein